MNMKAQAEDTTKKAEKISQLTCSYGLSANTSRLAYRSVYLPAVTYPLTSSYMSKRVLDKAQAKATRRFLRCHGFNPHMPRIVAYAPKLLGGLGMQCMYTTQGVRNTTQMLKHIRAGSTIGKLFRIAISWLQRWAEIGHCIMQRPDREIPPTSSKMLMSIREFLTECRATIRSNKNPRVKRLHNTFIMDHVMYSNFLRQKINMANKVRLYLQVETVSDISNSNGNKIDKIWLQEGQKPSTSTGLWPDIKKPSEKM